MGKGVIAVKPGWIVDNFKSPVAFVVKHSS